MTSMLLCILLAALTQGWDRPAIESSDLAAPGSAPVETQVEIPGKDTELKPVAEPVSSKSDKVSAAAQPEQNSEPHWEYDTEGKMVVRVEEKDAALEPPAVPASKKKDVVKVEDRQKTNSSGQIATFWFLMPRS